MGLGHLQKNFCTRLFYQTYQKKQVIVHGQMPLSGPPLQIHLNLYEVGGFHSPHFLLMYHGMQVRKEIRNNLSRGRLSTDSFFLQGRSFIRVSLSSGCIRLNFSEASHNPEEE